jgi:hypothetical protein
MFSSLDDIKDEIEENPQNYTEWFKICLPKVVEIMNKKKNL